MKSKPGESHKYRLKFIPAALDEWNALDGSIKSRYEKHSKSDWMRLMLRVHNYMANCTGATKLNSER